MAEKSRDENGTNDLDYFGGNEVNSIKHTKLNSKGTQKLTAFTTNEYKTLQSKNSFKSIHPIINQEDIDFMEQVERDDMENLYSEEKVKRAFFQFLKILIKDKIDRSPRSIAFRLIKANLLKDKLKNNFKACFLLLTCHYLNPSLKQKFEMFRLRNELEWALAQTQKKEGNK